MEPFSSSRLEKQCLNLRDFVPSKRFTFKPFSFISLIWFSLPRSAISSTALPSDDSVSESRKPTNDPIAPAP
jgi:hypothetical protein